MIAREISKIHEEFIRGEIENFELNKNFKGEVTVVISENKIKNSQPNNIELNKEEIINKIKKYLKKYSLKDTVDLIIETEKANKKEIYQLCLKIKNEKSN